MAVINLPALTASGTVTVTNNSASVTGDSTTLSVVHAGDKLMVDGSGAIGLVATDPVSSGGGCTLTLFTPWPGSTLTATAYKTTDAIDDATYEVLVQADHIGLFSGRSTYNSSSSGTVYISIDGAGGGTDPLAYVRQTTSSGTWVEISTITYYVDTTGSDTANDGLTAATPFATWQQAVNTLAALDLTGNTAAIIGAAGTYAAVTLKTIRGAQDVGQVSLIGGATTIISSSGDAITATNILTPWDITGLKFTSSGGDGIHVEKAQVRFNGGVAGACAKSKFYVLANGIVNLIANYTDIGNAKYHWYTGDAGAAIGGVGKTLTLTSTPAYTAFARTTAGVINCGGMTFSGSATGLRCQVTGGRINSAGSGLSYLPGNVKGVATPPGVYL